MTNQELFVAVIHRLKKYSDAVVLMALLEQHADVTEFKTSATQIALDLAGGQIVRRQAQQALARLADMGLIEIRTHANYRTHIKVDSSAVEALLRNSISEYLPGLRDVSFPFLDQVNASGKASSTSSVVPIRGD